MEKKRRTFLLFIIICNMSLNSSLPSPTKGKELFNWIFNGKKSASSSNYSPYRNEAPYSEESHQYKASNDSDCICGVVQHRRTRILYGEPSSRLEFPYLVQLLKYHQNTALSFIVKQCVGVLITLLHILTAAHCFSEQFEYGYAHLSDGQEYYIYSTIIHEDYMRIGGRTINDIAFALLGQRAELGNPIGPICLPTSDEDFAGFIGIAAGWGWITENGPMSGNLLKVMLPILSKQECEQSDYKYPMPDNTFCAGFMEGGPDTCKGDSGGPIMVRGPNEEMIVAGVVSYGRGCGRPRFPGVQTKVSSHLTWILEKIGNERLCRRPSGRSKR